MLARRQVSDVFGIAVLALLTAGFATALALKTPATLGPVVTDASVPVAVEEPRTITIRVRPEAYPRANDIATLMPLLREDFENMGKGMVDVKLRNRINAIMRRLPREE